MNISTQNTFWTTNRKLHQTLSRWICIFGLTFLIGVLFSGKHVWPAALLAAFYFISVALSGAFFMALQYLTRSGWSVAIRRVPEALAATMPAAAVVLFAVLAGGLGSLYEWSHGAGNDPLLQGKASWLNPGFFLFRALVYLALWIFLSRLMILASREQDMGVSTRPTEKNVRNSALFVIAFAITFSLACFDWIMSIEARWFSTMFGLYCFSGLFLNGLAVTTLLVILLKRKGPLCDIVSTEHLHDLGRFMFSFSAFWAYIWLSQYLLIWYANVPEETVYYIPRHQGLWTSVAGLNVLLNWLLPFFLLMPRAAKRNEGTLTLAALLLIAGRFVDLYFMIFPAFMPEAPKVSIWLVAAIGATLCLFLKQFLNAFAGAKPVPLRDPYLVESLRDHA